MARTVLTRLSVLSSVAATVLVVAACSNDGGIDAGTGGAAATGGSGATGTTGGATGTGGSTGGTASTGGTPSTGGTASTGGSSSGGAGTGGGGTVGSGGASTGGSSSGGGSAGAGGNGTGGGGGGGSSALFPGTEAYNCDAPTGDVPELTTTEVVAGLTKPVDITHTTVAGDMRMFVLEAGGDVLILENGQLAPTPFLSLGSRVTADASLGNETGLLALAFHPDYAQNGLFYVHYSAGAGVAGASARDTVIEEYKVSSDPNVADASTGRVIFTLSQPNTNHNGGTIAFGSDGYLYIGLGDGGGSGDVNGNAQNMNVLLGKILRIDPMASGGQPYSTPDGNLPGAAPEIWDYGMRNPFRFSFDACTGDLYIGDVGQDGYEEVDIEKKGEGHKNYGWKIMEGTHCYAPMMSCDETGITPPQIEIPQPTNQSMTGGSVYRGSAIPGLRGAYFLADFMSSGAWWARYDRDAGTTSSPASVGQEVNSPSVTAIKNGPDGELYFVLFGDAFMPKAGQGSIRKLAAIQ